MDCLKSHDNDGVIKRTRGFTVYKDDDAKRYKSLGNRNLRVMRKSKSDEE